MSTIDGASPTNPAEVPATSPQRVPRITIFIHNMPGGPTHPAASLIEPPLRTSGPVPGKLVRKRRRSGRHQLDESPWLDLAERTLCSWPITLRVAVLLAILLTGTAAVAAVLGVGGQLLLAALSLYSRRERGRRMSALRQERAAIE